MRHDPGAGPRECDGALDHREDSIELLFRTHFSERYGTGAPVTADAAASAARLREVWLTHHRTVDFDRFVADAFASLQYAYNRKYGQWDRVNDLRALYQDSWFAPIAPYTAALPPAATVLGVGVNDGREVRQLFDRELHIDLLDISSEAILKVGDQLGGYPHVRSFVGSFEDWEPACAGYDLFFSLRTLNSTSVDLASCVRKSVTLVRDGGILLYSVSNGYVHLVDGAPRAVKGMFRQETGTIDADRPEEMAREITVLLGTESVTVLDVVEQPSEIYVVAQKKQTDGGQSDGRR